MLLKCSSVGILRKSIQSSCSTTCLVSLFVGNSLLLFFLFHNYNTIIMLTRCVRWSRPVLLWNIVCSSVNVVHQLLVELHFLFFFLFHNDMSFKLFNNSVAKLQNKIENDETKREKFWPKRENHICCIFGAIFYCLTGASSPQGLSGAPLLFHVTFVVSSVSWPMNINKRRIASQPSPVANFKQPKKEIDCLRVCYVLSTC